MPPRRFRAMPTGPNRYWFRRQILASAPRFMVRRLRTDRTLATWCILVTSTATGLALAYVGRSAY